MYQCLYVVYQRGNIYYQQLSRHVATSKAQANLVLRTLPILTSKFIVHWPSQNKCETNGSSSAIHKISTLYLITCEVCPQDGNFHQHVSVSKLLSHVLINLHKLWYLTLSKVLSLFSVCGDNIR